MSVKLFFLRVVLAALPVMAIGQNVVINDVAFKTYLVSNYDINTNKDGEIQQGEASSYVGEIDIHGLGVVDLSGLEAFTSMTILNVSNNPLGTMDLSSNTVLKSLYCNACGLQSLDVSSLNNLQQLQCNTNALTSLDVSNNPNLRFLYCVDNQLSNLNLSGAADLQILYCQNNELAVLDLSQNGDVTEVLCQENDLTLLDVEVNAKLQALNCSDNNLSELYMANGNGHKFQFLDARNNPNLTCIEVDDDAWNSLSWANFIDATATFSENCP